MTSRQTLRCLAERAPSLRRAAAWRGRLALVSADDRAFCRRVRLDGWHLLPDDDRDVRFELHDVGRELLWPVALRALLLFAGAGLPGDETGGRLVMLPGDPPPDRAVGLHCSVHAERLAEPGADALFRVVLQTAAGARHTDEPTI